MPPQDPSEFDTSPGTAGGPSRPEGVGTAPLDRGASIGRYLVLDLLGSGGMGAVYAAFDSQLNRKVALKLLHSQLESGTRRDTEGRSRLLREAQAMAQLSHPNVLPVYDVGEHAGRVFISMELVEGSTLRQWLKEPRDWRDVVRAYVEAGKGLAAAHRAHLVHRDFKPDNVLLSRDGRVYVMDFGLARADTEASKALPDEPLVGLSGLPVSESPGASEPTPYAPRPSLSGRTSTPRLLQEEITQAGALAGTPGYIAPEQFWKRPPDAAADQFSFCASLYQGLYGQKAFAGKDVREVVGATLGGRVQPPPRDTRVPGWLHKVVLRGLAVNPTDRFPSMEALLVALQADPVVRYRRWAAAAGVALLLGSGVGAQRYMAGREVAACHAEGQGLATVWSGRQQAVERAFLATEKGFARDALHGVRSALGSYAASMAGMAEEACLATRVRGEASERAYSLRSACLQERHGELSALLDVFAEADAQVVEKAVAAARGLKELAPCADVDALMVQVQPPAGVEAARTLKTLREQFARARALHVSGKYKEALAAALPVREGAQALPFMPLEAEALLQLGRTERGLGQDAPAESHLQEALWRGVASGDKEVPVSAAAELLFLLAPKSTEREADVRRWYEMGRTLAERTPGGLERALSTLLSAYSMALSRQEKHVEAERLQREAVVLGEKVYGADSWEVVVLHNRLGAMLRRLERYAEALPLHDKGLLIAERQLGAEHPNLMAPLVELGTTLHALERDTEAIPYFTRALELGRRTLGPTHRNLIPTSHNLGLSLERIRRYEEAEKQFLLALQLSEQAYGMDSPLVNLELRSLVRVLLRTRQFARARPHAERALRIAESKLTPAQLGHRAAVLYLASVELGEGQDAKAMSRLQQLLDQEASGPLEPAVAGEARLRLAQALWRAQRGEEAVTALLGQAQSQLREASEQVPLEELEQWARQHGLPLPVHVSDGAAP